MDDESRAALISEIRTATIAECQRALRDSADAVEHIFRQHRLLAWAPDTVVTGYRRSASLLEALKPPRALAGRQGTS